MSDYRSIRAAEKTKITVMAIAFSLQVFTNSAIAVFLLGHSYV